MKRIFIIISLIAFAFFISCKDSGGQDVTRNASKTYKNGYTYAKYTGVAIDSLTTVQDTIDIVFNMRVANGALVKRVTVGTVLDLRAGTDTLCAVSVWGEDFDSDTHTGNAVIASTNTGQITASNTFDVFETAITSVTAEYLSAAPAITFLTDTAGLAGYPADSIVGNAFNITNAASTATDANLTWRKYVVRFVYPAAGDAVGTGLLIESVELKLYTY